MNAEKFFGTNELYKILELEPGAPINDVKTNYYRLARIYHPDRVVDEEKSTANEKFNILHQTYSILANPEKKILYDAGETRILFSKQTFVGKWEHYVTPLTSSAIECARRNYQGTDTEEADIIRQFNIGRGSMIHLLNTIPFMRVEDESRIIRIITDNMESGKIQKGPIRKIRR